MLKATLRCAVLLALVALGMVVTSLPSFAEVQNVKVGGDVNVRTFWRDNLDLRSDEGTTTAGIRADGGTFIMQTTAVNVGADLTENVSANVRVVNERDWDQTILESTNGGGNVNLSQAYLTLKELFYAPLTLKVGTQPIVWGRGFIIGSNLFPSVNSMGDDRNASITANEFTDLTAFDAIRGTLDLSGATGMPVTVDAIYVKLDENTANAADDVNLLGFNVGIKFDAMSGEAEAYYVNKRDKSTLASISNDNTGSVNTIGLRGSGRPVDGSTVWGELAYQFGRRPIDAALFMPAGDSQQAWAVNLGMDYTFADVATSPKIGAEWRFYSGKDVQGAVNGWATIAPGYFTTALREFQTGRTVAGFYPNDQECSARGAIATTGAVGTRPPCTAAGSNQHELAIFGNLTPIEDLNVNQRLSWFLLDTGALPFGNDTTVASKRKNYAGMEWDTVVNYNYTDDVQLGVIYALFAPGTVYVGGFDNSAQELITSVSVKF